MTRHRLLPLCCTLVSSLAFAHAGGVSGYSGQNGSTCTGCHSQSTPAAQVSLTGPTSLAPGASAVYTLTVTAGPAHAGGLDVSVKGSGASLSATGAQTYLSGGEVTQSSPLGFQNGAAAFTFTLTAPSSTGQVTLYAAGLSDNGNGSTSGDATATATLTITISSSGDGGSPPADGGTSGGGGGGGPPAPDGGGPGAVGGGMVQGCSAAGGVAGLSLVLSLGALALFLRARRVGA